MPSKKSAIFVWAFICICFSMGLTAQINSGIYISNIENERHELKINNGYLIHSVYESSPAKFIKTLGGFYTTTNGILNLKLEFNSDFEEDGLKEMEIPFSVENDKLTLNTDSPMIFMQVESMEQALDGAWLFATRGPDEGQDRRGEESPRKTLKFLLDNRFQWIAYNTETFKFSGTGGGSFSSKDGTYTEIIDFFSKDNSRVGAKLEFNYERKGNDWHHTGNNSKGEPMYEIWAKRVSEQ